MTRIGMRESKEKLRIIFLICTCLFSYQSHSEDTVKLHVHNSDDKKSTHNIDLINRALELSEPEYGPYNLSVITVSMSGPRMLQSSLLGERTNVSIVPANERWDKQHIVIRIPVRLGLLNYRLLLVNKADLPKFKKITTPKELMELTAGLTNYWETTYILKSQGFNLIESNHFEGLFLKLNRGHFNYLPRGIYEAYEELNSRKAKLPNVVIEPNIALNIPMLSYVYVSPNAPRVAKRIELGLQRLLDSGELRTLLYKYYADEISRANLKSRTIIKIENNYYTDEDIQAAEALLYGL